jgi:fructose-1,6-bisphosphatase/inositol monophosphatase family enzyme
VRVKTPSPFRGALLSALELGMPVLRKAQIYGIPEDAVEVKPDESALTWADREIEKILRSYLAMFGEVHGEEFGQFGDSDSDYLFILDPVDGTRTLINGDTGGASIIVYVYDKQERRIVASAIGRPGTGEVWLACDGKTEKYVWDGTQFIYVDECKVAAFESGTSQATVYTEYPPGTFARRGVQMLTEDGQVGLSARIRAAGFHHFAIGSNGTHHCLLAGGGQVAGVITTAIGGIQDLGGILMVENAGGLVRAFRMDAERELHDCDPHADLLMPGGYDFVVMAANDEIMERLIAALRQAAKL